MASLFGKPLTEKYRPATWAEVVGQQRTVERVQQLARRGGLTGRAFFITGQSGTRKTSIARLIAQEVAGEWDIEELDAGALTVASLRDLERNLSFRGMGDKGGRAILVGRAHLPPQAVKHACGFLFAKFNRRLPWGIRFSNDTAENWRRLPRPI